MGEVIYLSTPKAPQKPKRRRSGPWIYEELDGKRPRGHPPLERGPRGRVVLEVGQVWVEHHTHRLVVIKELFVARKGFYSYDVVFAAYLSRRDAHCLAESTFRLTHEVWDSFGLSQAELMIKLDHLSANDPTSPFKGKPDAAKRGRAFFGFDSNGHRTKD